jgi:hypothetical protein
LKREYHLIILLFKRRRGGVKRENPATGEITYTPAPLDLNLKEMANLVKNNILPLEVLSGL